MVYQLFGQDNDSSGLQSRFATICYKAKQLEEKLPKCANWSAIGFVKESTEFYFENSGGYYSGGLINMFIEAAAVIEEAVKQGEDIFIFSDAKQEQFYVYTEKHFEASNMNKRLIDIENEMRDEFVAYVLDDSIHLISKSTGK